MQAHARPQFTAVTGVSAGALIAPFAFLGPDWDVALQRAFTSDSIKHLERAVSRLSIAKKILLPTEAGKRDPLVQLVDRTYTGAMIDAIGREAARKLIVATTDLDSQETTLWDMTAIAAHGQLHAVGGMDEMPFLCTCGEKFMPKMCMAVELSNPCLSRIKHCPNCSRSSVSRT